MISGAGTITLTGANLDIVPSANVKVVVKNKVTSAKTILTPTSGTSTQIVFNVPALQAGIYEVRARLDPIGETNSFVINVRSTLSTSTYSISTQGGNVILAGQGLPS